MKASYPALKIQAANKPYWKQGQLCKTLGDVVESVYGAVYLDFGLRLSAVKGVSEGPIGQSYCGRDIKTTPLQGFYHLASNPYSCHLTCQLLTFSGYFFNHSQS